MTVTYSDKLASNSFNFGNFWRLLFVWRGSVYKLVWPEFLVYITIYFILTFIYRFGLQDEESKIVFEKIAYECDNFSQLIPVSFVLGFYVSLVVSRWWDQYAVMPWPDNLCIYIISNIEGTEKQARLTRRTINRYVNLTFVLTLRLISSPAKKRFPTYDHLIDAGLLEENEKKMLEKLDKSNEHVKYFIPIIWAGTIVKRARKENMIKDEIALKVLLEELNKYRGSCGALIGYDWINIPLVYTQTVTLAVYSFFFCTIMGRQFLATEKDETHTLDYYIPIFSCLEFVFYMGWLKVAEVLLNPFGEDDDDFEVNYLIDRNLQISDMIIDGMNDDHPDMVQDKFWEGIPRDLSYTIAATDHKIDAYKGSAADYEVENKMQQYLSENPENIKNLLLSSGATLTSVVNNEKLPETFKELEEESNLPSYRRRQKKVITSSVPPAMALFRNLTSRKFNADDFDWGEVETKVKTPEVEIKEKLPEVRITVAESQKDIGSEKIEIPKDPKQSANVSTTNPDIINPIDPEERAGSRSSFSKYMESRKQKGSLSSSPTDNDLSPFPNSFRRYSSSPRSSHANFLNIESPSPRHSQRGSQSSMGGSNGNLSTPHLIRKEDAKLFCASKPPLPSRDVIEKN